MKNIILTLFCFFSVMGFSQEALSVFDVARTGTAQQAEAMLKENPAVFDAVNKDGYAPLTLACYRGNIEVVKVILKSNADVNANSSMGTPIMAAVVKGKTEIVKLLINKNADVNLPDSNGTTPLIYATMFKNTEIITLLLKNKADKNLKDKNGKTAFEYATTTADETIINLLK
jgi:uncharacterized protein